MLFDPANLPYWILLGSGIVLFVFVIASGGGDDDVDLDADIDADIDADADVDAAGDFSLGHALGWLGIGKAPLILVLAMDLSLWGVMGWMLNVAMGAPNGLLSGVVLFGSMLASLFLGGLIARPIGKAFASFGEDVSSDRLVGCVGTVCSARIPLANEGKIGQVDVLDPARNLVTVNAALPEWATVSPRVGEKVLVIDRSSHFYLVITQNSPDQDHWLGNSSHPKDSQ